MEAGALDTALALYQSPSLAAATRLRPVPADVFEVIRIAAGDAEAIDQAVVRSGCPAAVVREAAQLYLKHVLFDPDADHYRVLGVAVDADQARMREHRRWLLKWLHPDRADDWDAVYAARVQQAWQQLRDPSRRAGYDQALAEREDWLIGARGPALRPVWTTRALAAGEGHPAGGRMGTWLIVGLGVPALVLALAWVAWPPGGREPAPTAAPPSARVGPEEAYVLEYVPDPDTVAPGMAEVRPAAGAPAVVARDPDPPAPRPPVVEQRPALEQRPSAVQPPASTPTPEAPSVQPVADVRPASAPESTTARPSPPAPATVRIDADAVDAAMSAFQAAYERGDIDALMAVFTQDARNRRGGREAIRQDYVRLFRSSRQRRLQWHSLDWQPGPDHARGEGGFVASITPRRGTTNTVRGRVRVEVVQQGARVRIRELWHEDQVP